MSAVMAEAPPISVAVALVVRDRSTVASTLAAVRRQVYETARVAIVGGESAGRHAADEEGVEWASTVAGLLEHLDPAFTHLWIVDSGAEPRPDALQALVFESERVDAAIAGSKLLDRDDPSRLVSVGIATDVFGTPYTGLDDGEIDAGQYDVVRDVAAVGGASMLVRRDLVRGIKGPDPILAPGASAIDLCQRARLRGGRIVVIPSSEVMVERRARPGWREEAGQLRAILKVYSPLTLLWAVPTLFLLGLIEAIVSPFLGRWTFFDWVRVWLWNLMHVGSTIRSRFIARHNRVAGDEELFRFQLRGSADLRTLFADVGQRLRDRLPGDETMTIADLGRELGQPAFVVGGFALAFAAVSTRTLWSGFPGVGYSLKLPESVSALLTSYAGGWNPGGFGSTDPLPPFTGLFGLVQVMTFSNPSLAAWLLIFGSFLLGTWGMTRLLRTWDIGPIAGTLAGLVLVAGPAARAVAAGTGLGTLVALGVLPWALRIPLSRWPGTGWGQIGRIAATGSITAILALASPLLLPVPFAALVLLALITPGTWSAWRSALVAGAGAVLAVPVLLPWLANADLLRYIAIGEAFWEPGVYLAVALGAAFVATILCAPKRLAQVTGWAGIAATVGALLARTGDYGPGREVELAGIAVASLGSAVVAGIALDLVRREELVTGWRRIVAGVGFLGAAAILVSTVLVILPGRAGLPNDQMEDAIGFTAAADGDPGSSRVLLVGPEDTLPGDSNDVLGAGYRVVSAPEPALWEVWLPRPDDADRALEEALTRLIEGESFRAGADLSPFGIRWVVFMGESPLQDVLAGQLDMVPLEGLHRTTFVSESDLAVRAVASDESEWRWRDNAYLADQPTQAEVVIAELADDGWGPDRQDAGWANSVSGEAGEIRFDPIQARRNQALVALGVFLLLPAMAWWGRRRR